MLKSIIGDYDKKSSKKQNIHSTCFDDVVGKRNTGDAVYFTGRKTPEIDGHQWAQLDTGEEKVRAAADYLKTEEPKQPKQDGGAGAIGQTAYDANAKPALPTIPASGVENKEDGKSSAVRTGRFKINDDITFVNIGEK